MTTQPLAARRPAPQLYYAAGGRVLDDPTLASLPPLPKDSRGRHVSWVILASTPGMYYWPPDSDDHETGQFFQPVDDAWLSYQIEAFAALTADGYTLPVRDRHQPAALRLGDVLALTTWTDPADDRVKLLGALAWAVPAAEDLIACGQLAYTSPGFHTFADDSGRLYEGVLSEVSICDAPYQKHIDGGRNRHILNTETPTTEIRPMADDTPTAPAEGAPDDTPMLTREDVVEMIAEAMQAYMDKDASGDEDDKPEDPAAEDHPEMTELAELRAQVNALTAEKARAEFAQSYPVGHTITLTAPLLDTLYALHTSNPEAFATLSEHAVAPAQPAAVELSEDRPPATPLSPIAWGKRYGSNTGAPAAEDLPEMTLDERKRAIRAQCKAEARGDASRALALYAERTRNLS